MLHYFPLEAAPPTAKRKAVIKVMGVGGGGCNAIQHMHSKGVSDVSFLALNTDVGHLETLSVPTLTLGMQRESGLGAGADPEVGKNAAEESAQDIESHLAQANMLFIAAGMGGGTGTGAAPVVARLARERGILTVAVVTKPFGWELSARCKTAEEGIERLATQVDSIITISNDKLSELHSDLLMEEAFACADDILCTAVCGVSDLIMKTGKINVDFADVSKVMRGSGKALIGVGEASSEHRAKDSVMSAMSSPLLESVDMKGATGLIVNVTSGRDLKLQEFQHIVSTVGETAASAEANLIKGWVIEDEMEGSVRVTLVVTVPSPESELHLDLDSLPRDSNGRRDYSKLEAPISGRADISLSRHTDSSLRDSLRSPATNASAPDEGRWTDINAFIER